MTKQTNGLILIISSFICILSLCVLFLSSYGLSIHQVTLKKDLFDDSKSVYEFPVANLWNKKYNVELRLHKKDGEFAFGVVDGEIKSKLRYEITIELKDGRNIIIARKVINCDSRIPIGFSKARIDMTLLSFDAMRDTSYHLTTVFRSSDGYFTTFQDRVNELVVVEDYDHGAMPLIGLFKLLSKAGFLIGLVVSGWMMYLIVKKNRQAQT